MNHTPPVDSKGSKYHPCNVCGADAISCLSPDMDIKGLCFCEAHREEVFGVYNLIMQGQDDLVKSLMKDWKFK